MKFLQAYYTSCDVGQTGVSGFQFYSTSEGISEEELQEIRELGSYEAPFGLTVNPTQDEVLNLFPIAFKYFRLKSGRVGVMQSTACTMEYTGRPGNFFTHTLLLEQGHFTYPPIMFHQSKLFMHDLTDVQKDVKTQPPALSVLTVNTHEDIMSGTYNKFNQAFIDNYLRHGSNKVLISKLVDIILGGKNQEKNIIIAGDELEEIIYVLCAALPGASVPELTFSTYSRQPDGQNVVLSGSSSEGSAFEFDNEWMQRSYYIFNKSAEQYPEVTDQSIFSETVVELLALQPGKLAGLYQFSDNFNAPKTTANLDLIANIYTHREFNNIWKQALNFVAEHARKEYIETFISDYNCLISELPTRLETAEDYLHLLTSVHSIIDRSSGVSVHFEWLFSLYTDTIHSKLGLPAKELIRFNKEITGFFIKEEKALFGKNFFKENVFLNLYNQSASDDAKLKALTLIIGTSKMISGKLCKIGNFYDVAGIRKFITTFKQGRKNISPETVQCFVTVYADELSDIIHQFSQVGDVDTAKWLIEQFYQNSPSAGDAALLEQSLLKAGQRTLYYYSLPFFYQCRKDDVDFFAIIIDQEPLDSDFQEINTFITSMFMKDTSVAISSETLNKILNYQKINDNTRKVIILQFDRNLLSQRLQSEDLRKLKIAKSRINVFFKEADIPTISLLISTEKLFSEKQYGLLTERILFFANTDKTKSVNLASHYQDKIIEGLLQKSDWKNIFSLAPHISSESLHGQITNFLIKTENLLPTITFIRFVAENETGERDELCKKILTGFGTKKYAKLKEQMKNETTIVASYFDITAKKIKFKRLINLKF